MGNNFFNNMTNQDENNNTDDSWSSSEMNNFNEDYSDDKNETNVHSLQIDLWTKTDPTELKNKIRKALKEAFYDVTINDFYESDTETYHIAFRCYFYEKEE